jgi:hypothetical protein
MNLRSARSANEGACIWLTFLGGPENRLAMMARKIDMQLGHFHQGSMTGQYAEA